MTYDDAVLNPERPASSLEERAAQIKAAYARQAESRYKEFQDLVEELINRWSMEGGSNTPDFILSEYLVGCLKAFDKAVNAREDWLDR